MQRRNFFRTLALGGATVAFSPIAKAADQLKPAAAKPDTNLKDAIAIPRTAHSMPGQYPGKVVKANHPACITDGKPSDAAANYPDIRIAATECQDENGSYINPEGKFYSEERIDKNHFFYVDVEGEYDACTGPCGTIPVPRPAPFRRCVIR